MTRKIENEHKLGQASGKTSTSRFVFSSLLKSSGLIIGLRVCGAVFGILTQLLLARFLGADDIGLFFVATGLAAILSIICTLGYPMIVPRIAAEAAGETSSSRLTMFMSRARFDSTIMCALMFSLVLLFVWTVPSFSVGLRNSLTLAALTLPAFVMLRLNGALANAMKRFELGFLPDLFVRPLLLLVLVFVISISMNRMNLGVILIGHAVIATMLAFWQMYLLRDRTDPVTIPAYVDKNMATELLQSWRRSAPPMVIVALFTGVFADLDIVIARIFLNNADTGIFGVCLKISLFVGFAIQAIHQLILRDTADALHAGDNHQLHTIITRANSLTLAASIGATIIVVAFGRDLLGLFGSQFQVGYECLVLLMFAQVVRAVAGPATQILTLTGHEKSCWPVFLSSIILLLVGNAVLIQWMGLLGAASAVLVVYALWCFWLAVIVRFKLGINTSFLLPEV